MPDKYDIDNLLSTVVDSKPVEFSKSFNDIIVSKITDAVNDKKIEIAQNMFTTPEPEEEPEIEETEENDEELEGSEEDED